MLPVYIDGDLVGHPPWYLTNSYYSITQGLYQGKIPTKKGKEFLMGKTKRSIRGKQSKKIITVRAYKKSNGIKVRAHRRSTPK